MRDISNREDILDSRDIIERLEELEGERQAYLDELEELEDGDEDRHTILQELDEWDEENMEELRILRKLNEQGSDYAADWSYGETLIRDSYFKDYAMDLADDIGAIDRNASWPTNCIDWDQAARELKMDYTSIDFDGVTYWVRS